MSAERTFAKGQRVGGINAEVVMRRSRRLAMGGTFLVAVSLAIQLNQKGALADDTLLLTAPVAFLGAMLAGWVLRPSAALAIAAAIVAGLCTLGVAQSGSAYTDEILLFAIPFSGAAAIVTGHVRGWAGKTVIAVSIVCIALAIGIGLTEMPVPFAIAHIAFIVSLPTIPVR